MTPIRPRPPPADASDYVEWTIAEPFNGKMIENPVPRDSAPLDAAQGDGSYDIRTGQAAAQKRFASH